MLYNWFFYHPGHIVGEEGGIPLFRFSMIYVYGLIFYIWLNDILFEQSRITYTPILIPILVNGYRGQTIASWLTWVYILRC